MRTGDAGYIDGDGLLFLVDRVKDMIVSAGENVYSAEVPERLSNWNYAKDIGETPDAL